MGITWSQFVDSSSWRRRSWGFGMASPAEAELSGQTHFVGLQSSLQGLALVPDSVFPQSQPVNVDDILRRKIR